MAKKTTTAAKSTAAKPKSTKLSDLAYIQANLAVPKNLHNDHRNFDYRSAESILAAAKPFVKERNCTVKLSDEIVMICDRFYIKATAELKKEGKLIEDAFAYAREPHSKTGMEDAQVTGSSSSYARKYALSGLFAINDEKDPDSNEKPTPPPAARNQKPATNPPKKTGTTTEKLPYKPSDAQKKFIGDLLKNKVFTDADRDSYRDRYEHLATGKETSMFINEIKTEKEKREKSAK